MPPAPLPQSRFLRYLLEHNAQSLPGFQRWLFQPGMRFNSLEKWWGAGGPRPTPHEGLDLGYFEGKGHRILPVDGSLRIPAPFAGAIIKIHRDFLGHSIFISHEIFNDQGQQLYSAFGHTTPLDSLRIGQPVAEGEVIALIAACAANHAAIPPHLHITFAWMPVPLDPAELTWENLGRHPAITLLDPLAILAPAA